MDDAEEWGEAELAEAWKNAEPVELEPPYRLEPRRLDHMMSIRVGPDDMTKLRTAADAAGISVSALVRQAALYYADKLTADIPAHTCVMLGCQWCDPL